MNNKKKSNHKKSIIRVLSFTRRFVQNEPMLDAQVVEEFQRLSRKIKLTVIAYELDDKKYENLTLLRASNFSLPRLERLCKIISYTIATIKNRNQYDIVYLRFLENQFTITGIIAKIFLRKKLVVWIGASVRTRRIKSERFQRPFVKIALKLSDKILTTSHQVIQDIENNIGELDRNKISFFSRGVNIDKFRPSDRHKADNILLTVSRLAPVKGIEDMIKAIHYVKNEIPDIILMIVGKGRGPYYHQLKNLVIKLGCENNVKFVGPIPYNQLVQIYQNSKIFLLTSITEGQPTALMEAMSCGIPAITTPVGSIPNMIQDGINGFIIKNGDIKLLTEKIVLLITNDAIRDKMGINARKTTQKNYDIETYVDNLFRCFQKENNENS